MVFPSVCVCVCAFVYVCVCVCVCVLHHLLVNVKTVLSVCEITIVFMYNMKLFIYVVCSREITEWMKKAYISRM